MKQVLFTVAVCLFISSNLSAQSNLLRELINLPAPLPVNEFANRPKHTSGFYDDKNPPADDAPVEDLIDYWQARSNINSSDKGSTPRASIKSSLRIIDVVESAPYKFNDFLKIMPLETEVIGRVKNLYDVKQGADDVSDYWREQVKNWLKFNTDTYADELLAEAQTVKDHQKNGGIVKEKELRAATEFDWNNTAPLLEKFRKDTTNPRTAVFAESLIYGHALKIKDAAEIEICRNRLKAIAEDIKVSGEERKTALDALFENEEWPDFDNWYLLLFADETLLELRLSEHVITAPLISITNKNPGKWVPKLTELVGNKNRKIHNAAVNCLIEIAEKTPSREGLEPLLPWLTNPAWAEDTGSDRETLIYKLSVVDLPESIPGLIWLLDNEDSNVAADTLAKYKDPRAIPSLKNVLFKTVDERSRQSLIAALIACGGLSDAQMAESVEDYARTLMAPDGFQKITERDEWEDENPLPLTISIGKFLTKQKEPDGQFVSLLIRRKQILQKENPELAKVLSQILTGWHGRIVDLEMLSRIENNQAEAETIVIALSRRVELKLSVSNEIFAMRGKSGLAGAMEACLSEDQTEILSAFHSENTETQIGTMACARLLRKPLPVHEVGALLDSSDKLTALAAEKYLESEDSNEARQLVLAKHPGEALILGARASYDGSGSGILKALNQLYASVDRSYGNHLHPDSSSLVRLDKFENSLRTEIITNQDLLEIYTIVPFYVIRVYKNRVVLTYLEDKSRFREGELKREEFDELKREIEESEIEEMPPYFDTCHYDCGVFEYAHFNRNGGRRFFAYSGFTSFMGIRANFQALSESGTMKRHYYLENKIKNLEVLLTDENLQPKAVWKNDEDFRLLISDEKKKEEIEEEISQLSKIDDKNEELDYKIKQSNVIRRRAERAVEHFEWREFKNGKLGAKTEEPEGVPFLRDKLSFPDVEDLDSNDNAGQSIYGNYEIRRGGSGGQNGLWKINRSEKTKIADGWFGGSPIVSGDWVVAAKTDSDWSDPNDVVRVNLLTGKQIKVKLPPAGDFEPVAFVAAHHKVLLRRAADDNTKPGNNNPSPAVPEYYLLDAATGKTEMLKGEFLPLRQQKYRTLQSTGKPDEFWAAINDRDKNETEIGIYNEKNFTFKSLLRLPDILLDSMNIWVDEKEAKVYFIYNGDFSRKPQLLSVPLTVGEMVKPDNSR